MIKKQLSPNYDEFYNWATSGYKSKIDIQRSKDRVVETNEIFTSLDIVMYGLELAYPIEFFKDKTIVYSDNCVGEGSWLVGMALLRMKHGLTHEDAIQNLRGVDIMIDNIDACRIRLMCGNDSLRDEVEKNIVMHSKKKGGALEYGYTFKPMGPARRRTEKDARIKKEREAVKKQKEQEKLAKKKQQEKDRAKAKAKKEREKAERLAKKEEARIKREKSKSKLTILNPEHFEVHE